MKKIILSLMMISVAGAAAVGATQAYFTSDAFVKSEFMGTGSLKINISADDTYYQNTPGGAVRTSVPVKFTNLKPGDTLRQWVTLHNAGTLDIGHLTVQATYVTDTKGLFDQILVSVIGFDNTAPSGPYANNAYFTPGWGTGGSTINTWLTGAPKDILSPSAVIWSAGSTPSVIAAGQDDLVVLDFTVPTTLGNTYQGANAAFNLEFHAEQVHP